MQTESETSSLCAPSLRERERERESKVIEPQVGSLEGRSRVEPLALLFVYLFLLAARVSWTLNSHHGKATRFPV